MNPGTICRGGLGVIALVGIGLLTGTILQSRFGGIEVIGTTGVAAIAGPHTGMAVGPARGVPVLTIFGDYQCPACAALERVAGDTLRALARSGHIRFVYHHAPLRGHYRAAIAADAARCAAGFGAAWAAHTVLYERAGWWAVHAAPADAIVRAFAPLMPDTAALRECMASDAARRRAAADRSLADRIGIREVPTVFWKDQRLRVRSWPALVRLVAAGSGAS